MKYKFLQSAYPFMFKQCERQFWKWLNPVFNSYDKDRVKEVGADRACAEWLMRNGAMIKFEKTEEWQNDYNALPPLNKKPKISEVDATDSSISMAGGGFRYFENLGIRSIKLHRCNYLEDDALSHLKCLAHLKELQVTSCGNITDSGILDLENVKSLEKLYMYDLLGVKDRKKCIEVLSQALPQCAINFPWAQESERPKN